MSATIVTLVVCNLFMLGLGLQHNVNDDIAQIKEELRRQGELTQTLLERNQQLTYHIAQQDKLINKQIERIDALEHTNTVLKELILPALHQHPATSSIDKTGHSNSSHGSNETAGMVHSTRRRQAVTGPVAFQASVSKAVETHINVHDKIVFDKVIFQVGGGYHEQFGLFIAPKAGIYIFSLSALCYYNGDIGVYIMKNGQQIGGAFGDSRDGHGFDQGAVSVVMSLNLGDEVYVEARTTVNSSIIGNDMSTFMGCLISDQ